MLDKILSFIASAFVVKTQTIESANSSITAVKRSGVIVVRFNGFTNLPAGWTTLGTLPEGWRPREELFMRPDTPEKTLKLRINIRADGTILVYNYGTLIENAANAREILTFVGGGYCKGWKFNALRFRYRIGGGVNVGQDSIIHRRLYGEDHNDHKDKPRNWRGERSRSASRKNGYCLWINSNERGNHGWFDSCVRNTYDESKQRRIRDNRLEQVERFIVSWVREQLQQHRSTQEQRVNECASNRERSLAQIYSCLHSIITLERGCLSC